MKVELTEQQVRNQLAFNERVLATVTTEAEALLGLRTKLIQSLENAKPPAVAPPDVESKDEK